MPKKITSKPPDDSKKSATQVSQSKILKNLAKHLADDYLPSSNSKIEDPQIQKVNRLIKKSSKEISEKIEIKRSGQNSKKSHSFKSPRSFDGISDDKEAKTLMVEQIRKLERENIKLKHDLELLHEDYDKEKITLKKNVRDLKKELHRSAPISDSKIFSLSKDLRSVVESMQSLSESGKTLDFEYGQENYENNNKLPINIDLGSKIKSTKLKVETSSLLSRDQNQEARKVESQSKYKKKIEVVKQESTKSKVAKKSQSKKTKIIAGSAASVLLVIVGITAILTKKTNVDQQIVDDYLHQKQASAGEVKGAVVEMSDPSGREKTEFKHNDISYEEMKWETFRDGFLNFQVDYPINAVDLLHTGNTVTFLRKDSYLYKIQRMQSDESPQEYYQRMQENGDFKYFVEEDDVSSKETIHLTLEENDVEFPGNRYIASNNGFIYDIWYASGSAYFDDVDMKIVDRMIETDKIL